MYGDTRAIVFALGVLAPRDTAWLWAEISGLCAGSALTEGSALCAGSAREAHPADQITDTGGTRIVPRPPRSLHQRGILSEMDSLNSSEIARTSGRYIAHARTGMAENVPGISHLTR